MGPSHLCCILSHTNQCVLHPCKIFILTYFIDNTNDLKTKHHHCDKWSIRIMVFDIMSGSEYCTHLTSLLTLSYSITGTCCYNLTPQGKTRKSSLHCNTRFTLKSLRNTRSSRKECLFPPHYCHCHLGNLLGYGLIINTFPLMV